MKQFSIIAIALLAILLPANTANAQASNEREAIEKLVDNYIKTINDGDLELVSQIWSHADYATFIGPQGRFVGWEAIRDGIVAGFKNGFTKRDLKKDNLIININGNSAWAEFTWTFNSTSTSGRTGQSRGRESQIFEKVNGEWRLVHIHYSGMR